MSKTDETTTRAEYREAGASGHAEDGGPAPLRFPCRQCAAELQYAPGTNVLRCPYCGLRNEIAPAAAAIEELDYLEHLRMLAEHEPHQEMQVIKCGACAAETERPENLDAWQCAFCGADVLATEASFRLIKPRSVLPFHVPSNEAHQIFRKWIASRWFAPNRLKRFGRSGGRLEGMYVPFWTYDSRTVTDYTGQRGKYYWETQRYTTVVNGKRVQRTRQVRRTRWYPASGRVQNTFDDLLVAGSQSLPERELNELGPWDLPNLTPYADEYVAGFKSEKYQVGLEAGFEVARQMMEPAIRMTIRRDIGGDTQRIHSMDSQYFDITFKHMLLPVWISAYRLGDRVFRFMVNARTGELIGQRPYSAWKITGAVLAALAAIGAIALLVSMTRG